MLHLVAWISLVVAFACATVIAADEVGRPQRMFIMNIVWPVTALYFSVFALWAYLRFGREKKDPSGGGMQMPEPKGPPPARQIALATSHCGAGCVLADIAAEFAVFGFAWTIGNELFASYLVDFLAAWSLGVVFQYFTIKPMRNLSVRDGIVAAMKADTLSITAFQIGMYAWMALVFYVLFPRPHLKPVQPEYWLMMQVAMVIGFLTSYPMNRWLVQHGWKERMG